MAIITVDVELEEFSDDDFLSELKYRLERSNRFKEKYNKVIKANKNDWYSQTLDEHYKIKAFLEGKNNKTVEQIEEFFRI